MLPLISHRLFDVINFELSPLVTSAGISMLKELEEKAGVVLPQDLTTSEVNEYLQKKVKELGYECPPPLTTARLIDRVSSHLLLLHLQHVLL